MPLGFTHGVKDLELCQFDFHLLRDWYYIKSWVLTQTYGALLLNDWMLDLFRHSNITTVSSFHH